MEAIERARRYVAKMPPAIAGQNGHDATFAVARALVQVLNLSRHDADVVLGEYNQRCDPPWSERELAHKLDSAERGRGSAPPEASSGQRRPEGAPPITQGQAARTPRTGLFDIKPAGTRSLPKARTLRTAFFLPSAKEDKPSAVPNSARVGENLSEVSEPLVGDVSGPASPNLSEVSEPLLPTGESTAGELTHVLKLVHTESPVARDTRQGFATWVKRDGASFRAEVRHCEIRIGRQLGGADRKVKP